MPKKAAKPAPKAAAKKAMPKVKTAPKAMPKGKVSAKAAPKASQNPIEGMLKGAEQAYGKFQKGRTSFMDDYRTGYNKNYK